MVFGELLGRGIVVDVRVHQEHLPVRQHQAVHACVRLHAFPPADHLVGRYALVLCLAGYLVGLFRDEARDSVMAALGAVAVAAGLATLLYGALGGLLSDGRVGGHAILSSLPFSIAYDVLLAPFVVPWVMKLARRTEPQVTRK